MVDDVRVAYSPELQFSSQTPQNTGKTKKRLNAGTEKITVIEAGRALAAVLVVTYHVDKFYFEKADYFKNQAFGRFFECGHSGVEFFFVLSGFLIFASHVNDLGKLNRFWSFVRKRFIRVYPFYWFVTITLILVSSRVPNVSSRLHSWKDIFGSFLLIGINPFSSVIYVSWTLFHELLFYIVISLMIVNIHMGILAITIWTALCAGADNLTLMPSYIFAFVNVLFAFGIGAFWVCKFMSVPIAIASAIGGSAVFILSAVDDVYVHFLSRDVQIICYGLGSSLLISGLTYLERTRLLRAPRALQLCGQASYSIYLTHSYVVAPLAKTLVVTRAVTWLPAEIGLILLTLSAVFFGVMVHYLIERPTLHVFRKALSSTNMK